MTTEAKVNAVLLPAIVRCRHCKTIERREMAFSVATYRTPYPPGEEVEYRPKTGTRLCPVCDGLLDIRQITGVEDATVPCGRRCQEAVGPDCRCSCGNRNHGIAHS